MDAIPFIDLRPSIEPIRAGIDAAIRRVVDRGVFLNGEEVLAFQEEWAAYCGTGYAVACASGTDALRLAIPKIRQKCVMRYPANSCRYTQVALEGSFHDAIPVDVNPETGMPYRPVSAPVLLYGRTSQTVFDKSVVDAAQAAGWKPGPHRDINVGWSFFPTKNLGCWGDGGAMTTNCRDHYVAASRERDSRHSRMAEIQAAVLRTKLPFLDEWNAERNRLASCYYDCLPLGFKPICPPGSPSNHHIFGVLSERRDELMAYLKSRNVGCKIHYDTPLAPLPGAVRWCSQVLSLPLWVGMSPEMVRVVCDCLKTF